MPYEILGNHYLFPTEPFLRDDKHFVPLRDTVETLGGRVDFDAASDSAVATITSYAARVVAGNRHVDVSGTPVTLSADPFVEKDEFYVPFDFFRDAYGYDVMFDNGTVSITLPGQTNPQGA